MRLGHGRWSRHPFVRLFRSVRPSPIVYTALIVCDGITNTLSQGFVLLLTKWLGDVAISHSTVVLSRISVWVGVYVLAWWAVPLALSTSTDRFAVVSKYAMRKDVIRRLLSARPDQVSSLPAGDLINRVNGDVDKLSEVYRSWYRHNILAVSSVVGAFVFGAVLNLRIFLLVNLLGLALIGVNRWFKAPLFAAAQTLRQGVGVVTQGVIDVVRGHEALMVLPDQTAVTTRFDNMVDDVRKAEIRVGDTDLGVDAVNTVIYFLFDLAILVVGGAMVVERSLNIGALLAARLAGSMVFNIYNYYAQLFSTLQASEVAAERVFGLLDLEREPRGVCAPVSLPSVGEVIVRFRDVEFGYPGQVDSVLKRLSLYLFGELRWDRYISLGDGTSAGSVYHI